MVNWMPIVIAGGILLLGSSAGEVENTTVPTTEISAYTCKIGKEFYSKKREKCKKCRRCKELATDYLDYPIKLNDDNQPIECYPCYCRPKVKRFNPAIDRCEKCPVCINGFINTTVEISIDKYRGGLECPECICNHGFFINYQTGYQCASCLNCTGENREFTKDCTADTNAVCGDCLDGYREPSLHGAACVKNTTGQIATTTTTDMMPIHYSDKDLKESAEVQHRSYIILIVALVVIVAIAFGVIYLVYRIIQNTLYCCPWQTPPGSLATVSTSRTRSVDPKDIQTDGLDETVFGSLLNSVSSELHQSADISGELVERHVLLHSGSSFCIHAQAVQVGDNNQMTITTDPS